MYHKTLNRMFGWISKDRTTRIARVNLSLDIDEITAARLLAYFKLPMHATASDGAALSFSAADIREAALTWAISHGDPRQADFSDRVSEEAAREIYLNLVAKLTPTENS